ncbi:hypothetical protein ACM25P_03290 [Vreelandella alkaliphila]|uniref:hypothetical protein n=1 Tax=Vreelandella alkaliphila TaxID=272774 RepID=UPI0039F49D86
MKHFNKWLVGVVVGVAVIAIVLYIWNFWGRPPSEDPSDWAHFATYLSGTVGVTAVVATLFAFVKTLGQQQALIDSQEEMIESQKTQLSLTRSQLELEKERREIELAYNSSFTIFPMLMDSLKKDLDQDFWAASEREKEVLDRVVEEFRNYDFLNYDLISDMEDYASIILSCNEYSVYEFADGIFLKLDKIYAFMLSKLKIEEGLKSYYESYLLSNYNHATTYYHYIYCYHAYLFGCGETDYANLGVSLLDLPNDYQENRDTYHAWLTIGKKVKKVKEGVKASNEQKAR